MRVIRIHESNKVGFYYNPNDGKDLFKSDYSSKAMLKIKWKSIFKDEIQRAVENVTERLVVRL